MPAVIEPAYTYRAKYRSNYDGDTLRVDIDLGMGITNRGEDGKGVVLRLHRINTPELRNKNSEVKKRAIAAKDFVARVLTFPAVTVQGPQSREIIVQTIKDKTGKYGRYIAVVWYKDDGGAWHILNDDLVEQELAEVKDY